MQELDDLRLTVTAPEGAFPVKPLMRAEICRDDQVLRTVKERLGEDFEWTAIHFLFRTSAGGTAPQKALRYSVRGERIRSAAEVRLLHADENGRLREIRPEKLLIRADELIFEECDSNTVYVLVLRPSAPDDGPDGSPTGTPEAVSPAPASEEPEASSLPLAAEAEDGDDTSDTETVDGEEASDGEAANGEAATDEEAADEETADGEEASDGEDADGNDPSDGEDADGEDPSDEETDDSEDASEAAMPSMTFDETLESLTVHVEAVEGTFPEGTVMRLAWVTAEDVLAAIGEAVDGVVAEVRAVDITFLNADGEEIEPLKEIRVFFRDEMIKQAESIEVVHVDSDNSASVMVQDNEGTGDDEIAFNSDSFSVYGYVSVVIQDVILGSDGENYRITVTCAPEALVPAEAKLEVREITDEAPEYYEYISLAKDALGWAEGSPSYARLFDIKIVDPDGNKVEIAAPVDVKIELADKADGADTQVVHFADGAERGDVVKDAAVDGAALTFTAEGFSAYAIVTGPSAVPMGWSKVASLQELASRGAAGLYIGHTDGYYFTNALVDDGSRVGIAKTRPAQSYPGDTGAVLYYFEPAGEANQYYVYCLSGEDRQYVYNGGDNSLSFTPDPQTVFTASIDSSGRFEFSSGAWYWNMQGGAGGKRFCAYNSAGDNNNKLSLWYYSTSDSDPYGMDGRTYGLMNWNGGAAGKAMMAAQDGNALQAKPLTVMAHKDHNEDKLFVPNDSDISMWRFQWVSGDNYRLSSVSDGSTKYLKLDADGLSLVSDVAGASLIQVVPGTGIRAGQIFLECGGTILTYSGKVETGFSVGGVTGSEWLYLVNLSELTSDYFMTYSARKVSVSDTSVTNGSRIIVYTRSWNETEKKYEFYAIDYDGTLVRCYESGDSIEWVGSRINTMLWNFVEYYYEGTNTPNYYYELYNQYSEKFIAPRVGGQFLSDDTIGLNLNGRKNNRYYSSILAWDDPNYSYSGLKVENGQIVSCPKSEAMDFYFAVMEDIPVNDNLNTVPTVDHEAYGITMKIKDFDSRAGMNIFGNDEGGAVLYTQPGLLSTGMDSPDGYPTTATGNSMRSFFSGANPVNHLFIQSTYQGTGYFEFDSSQNYATLKGKSGGDFTVYKELGSYDSGGNKPTLKHGQFFPFNDLEPGVFASVNRENLYSATGSALPDGDPRKHEKLYLIKNANCFFGAELTASFVQTPNGLDAWGHDIIFEFSGDDDFWLYVDGELIIDLGGIHSALPGTVNYRTGEVTVNGEHLTLRDLFYDNYVGRGHTEAEAQAYVDELFELSDEGNWVFKEYTTHTMRIFYLERGAGASNLHMRFNLASVKPGTVLLSKELAGVDTSESILSEFPYQIWYKTSSDEDATEYLLEQGDALNTTVFYKDSDSPVKYEASVTVDGLTYEKVFFLKPGETAEIHLPEETVSYRIVECGVSTDIYEKVTVNNEEIEGAAGAGYPSNRKDYGIGYDTTNNRARVAYVNEVRPSALRTLTFSKRLFDETGVNQIHSDPATFSFRLSLGTEFDESLTLANMYTYHVKDPSGNYCRWDADTQTFASIGKADYAALTAAEKQSVSFATSINGSISRIPVDYVVEVRELLAGTRFGVVERPWEIPDGYSFRNYLYNGIESEAAALTGITDTIRADSNPDPHVDVCNLRGWGLRMRKIWTDADYMDTRADAFFAVYTDDGSGALTLVEGTVRRLAQSESTIYWYFLPLPVDVPFAQYMIREVTLTDPTVGDDGVVTSYGSIEPIDDGSQFVIRGRQKGESQDSDFTYTVCYANGTQAEDSNVREDTVTNSRPGVVLKKQDRHGGALPGAVFTLKDDTGALIGTFTSDEEGLITVAFLRENVEYTLTEIQTPRGWLGIDEPVSIRLSGSELSVSGAAEGTYECVTEGGELTLILKNRPAVYRVLKIDAATQAPLAGITFALHRQVTVDGVTTIDLNPMPGYEVLTTGSDGVLQIPYDTLPAGTYELRETSCLNGYQKLSGYIRFTVSDTGRYDLVAGQYPPDVTLTETIETDESVTFELTIPNAPNYVSVWKTDMEYNTITSGATFALYAAADYDDSAGRPKSGKTPIFTGTTDGDGLLFLGSLQEGSYRLVETAAPAGYYPAQTAIRIDVYNDRVLALQAGAPAEVCRSGEAHWVAGQNEHTWQVRVWNSAGCALPNTGGRGTAALYALGAVLTLGAAFLLTFRKRQRTI